MEDCRVVELRHRGEPAEFPGELHEWEIPPDKGENGIGWRTEETQEHGEEHPNKFDTWHLQ